MADHVDTPRPARRPLRPRLHLSTLLVTATAGAIFLLANVPGQLAFDPGIGIQGKRGPHFEGDVRCEHGWPSVFLHRRGVQVNAPPWWRLSLWNLREGVERFSLRSLLWDVGIGILCLAIVAVAFEAWRRRRRAVYQLHLADLFLLLAAGAAALSFLAVHRARYRAQQRVLAVIEQGRDPEQWRGPISEFVDWEPGGPTWLRNLLGDGSFRTFDRVVAMYLEGTELRHGVDLPSLKVVRLPLAGLTNEQLKSLEQLPQLEALDMCFAWQRHDEDQREAESDEAAEYIRLPRLPQLRGINLYDAAFRGDGLEHLVNIEMLELTDTDVDDNAVRKLVHCKRLKFLSLAGTPVTDRSVESLKQLRSLDVLCLGRNLSDQAVEELRKALPNCEIEH